MHWPTVRDVLKRPIGPAIGMFGQFLFMPLVSNNWKLIFRHTLQAPLRIFNKNKQFDYCIIVKTISSSSFIILKNI